MLGKCTNNTGPGGTSRVSGSATPSSNSTSLRQDEVLVYGIDPEFTDNVTIVDQKTLIGWLISFEQFGSGTLTPGSAPGSGVDYTYDITTGTIVLVNGTTYNSGQKMIIHFEPQISTGSAPPSSEELYLEE